MTPRRHRARADSTLTAGAVLVLSVAGAAVEPGSRAAPAPVTVPAADPLRAHVAPPAACRCGPRGDLSLPAGAARP